MLKNSPLCIFLGILTDFAQKYAPLCLMMSPKYPKIDENPILGLYWYVFGIFDPLTCNIFIFLLQFLEELIDTVILSHQAALYMVLGGCGDYFSVFSLTPPGPRGGQIYPDFFCPSITFFKIRFSKITTRRKIVRVL